MVIPFNVDVLLITPQTLRASKQSLGQAMAWRHWQIVQTYVALDTLPN